MPSIMHYETPLGVYTGVFDYDPEAEIFHGDVVNTNAVLTFQGTSIEELKEALKDTVDVYLEWCKERGKEPQKPFSGNIPLRLGPELHGKLAAAALSEHKSINQFVRDIIVRTLEASSVPPSWSPRLPLIPGRPVSNKELTRSRKRAG